jgi:NAD(P)-dependent dehydrogenase (short-subunit alcohol dehydrogenase family)
MRVVVTGSSGGIGRAIVKRQAAAGAFVVGVDRVAPQSADASLHIDCNLTSLPQAAAAAQHISASVDGIDLLVHAAGVFYDDSTAGKSEAAIEELWRINYLCPYALSEQLLPLLKQGTRPHVIFISSADAIVASGGQECEIGVVHDAYYAASKGALITATRALAMRWASFGVRVNAICPTIVRTPMAESLLSQQGKEAQLAKHIPLGRICEPEDVAIAVEALHSLTMTTAHVLPVDGGYLCR